MGTTPALVDSVIAPVSRFEAVFSKKVFRKFVLLIQLHFPNLCILLIFGSVALASFLFLSLPCPEH